jgi:phosphoglycolate phosphatase
LFQAVLFDLDGTLLDTLRDLADSMNAVLAALGHPTHPVDAYRTFVGDGMDVLVRRTLPPERRSPEEIARALDDMRAWYQAHWRDTTRPYPGVPDLLDGLASSNIPFAVLSNKPDDFTRTCVAEMLPSWRPAAVRGLRPDSPRKPDPTAALEMAEGLGLPPSRVLYVGDTGIDMLTASRSGMWGLGATWGFRGEEELRACGALALARHPRDVLARALAGPQGDSP